MADLQDDELYLPRTVVNKLIKEMVPNIRVSNDARDLLLNCCSEYIHLLASEASEVSEKQQKKVISPEHVLEALSTLGFPEYIDDVKAVHREYKEQASKHRRRGKSRLERLGIPEEELLRQQQQLFEEARQQHLECGLGSGCGDLEVPLTQNDLLEQQRMQQQAQGPSPLPTPSQAPPITTSHSLPLPFPSTASQLTSTQPVLPASSHLSSPPAPPLSAAQLLSQQASRSPNTQQQSPASVQLQASPSSLPPPSASSTPAAAPSSQSSLLPASLPPNLQATASLLQSLTSGQAGVRGAHPSPPLLSLPHLLPLSPAVLQAMQGAAGGTSSSLLQASQTANLLQAARATELLRQQVAAQQASLAAVQQQQLKYLQQQQQQGQGQGERERERDGGGQGQQLN